MRKTPMPTGMKVGTCCDLLSRIAEYVKQKEEDAREKYGWASVQAEAEQRKYDALLEARAVIVKEFDL